LPISTTCRWRTGQSQPHPSAAELGAPAPRLVVHDHRVVALLVPFADDAPPAFARAPVRQPQPAVATQNGCDVAGAEHRAEVDALAVPVALRRAEPVEPARDGVDQPGEPRVAGGAGEGGVLDTAAAAR